MASPPRASAVCVSAVAAVGVASVTSASSFLDPELLEELVDDDRLRVRQCEVRDGEEPHDLDLAERLAVDGRIFAGEGLEADERHERGVLEEADPDRRDQR